MSFLTRVARRLIGTQDTTGRDLQLRAETLLVYALVTRSTPIFGNFSPNVLSRCADLVNSNADGIASFEEQAIAVKSFLTQSVVRTLRVASRPIHHRKLDAACEKRSLHEHINQEAKKQLGFVPTVEKSNIPNAGLGLYVEGRAQAGSLLGLYPGTCYMPSDLKHIPGFPNITENNDYLMWRYDGIVFDGKDALQSENDGLENDMQEVHEADTQDPTSFREEPVTCFAHPFSMGHRINHPPLGMSPNCLQFMLDVRLTPTTRELRGFIPNELFGPVGRNSRSLFERMQNAGVRQRVPSTSAFVSDSTSPLYIPTIAIIATRDLKDEEVFMNYRYNPSGPDVPSWYHDCDPESSQRRWKKTGAFF